MAPATDSPTIKIGGTEYDINRDFTWRELLTVEELSGQPLARPESLAMFAVLAAFVFVVLKRKEETLIWEGFLDRNINELIDDAESDTEPAPKAKGAAKRRPTQPSA